MWSEVSLPTTTQVRDAFGVEVGELRPHPAGFEADAFTDCNSRFINWYCRMLE
jgi:hypothetical protein